MHEYNSSNFGLAFCTALLFRKDKGVFAILTEMQFKKDRTLVGAKDKLLIFLDEYLKRTDNALTEHILDIKVWPLLSTS